MSFTLLGVILFALLALGAAISAYFGYRSGLLQSSIKFAAVVAAAFLGAAISPLITSLLKIQLLDLLLNIEPIEIFYHEFEIYAPLFEILGSMLSSAVVFVPVFILLYVIARIAIGFVYRYKLGDVPSSSFEYLSEDATYLEKNDKPMGAIVSAVCGLFIVITLLSPVVGTIRSLSGVIKIAGDVKEASPEKDMDITPLLACEDYANDAIVIVIDACGAGTLFDISTSMSVEGGITNPSKELRALKKINVAAVLKAIENIGEFSDEDVAALENLTASINKTPLLKNIVLMTVQGMTKAWLNDEEFLNTKKPYVSDNNAVDFFIDGILRALSISTVETIDEDLNTFLGLFNILDGYDHIFEAEDYAELADAIVNSDLLGKLKAELSANPRMKQVEHIVDEIVMQAVAEEISDFTKYEYVDREALFTQIAEALNDTIEINTEARTEYIAGELEIAFEEYGVYSSEEISEKIATVLISGVPEKNGVISVDAVRTYFESFLENYAGTVD